ncbi:MAG: AAA family ATPase [Thermodesulfovibrionales bacterium]|jgi:type II secretory pathway predicted ATPase ExeA
MKRTEAIHKIPFRPIRLKRLLLDCDISQTAVASAVGCSRGAMCVACNHRGYEPGSVKGFGGAVEAFVSASPAAMQWLASKGLAVTNIWDTDSGGTLRGSNPVNAQVRRHHDHAWQPGDPTAIESQEVVEMLSDGAMKHFKLFRSPFSNDIREAGDIYLSDEHRYIEAAMIDAARHGGFLAIIGEVGSGKSVMRKKVVSELAKDEQARIIYPRMIDKTRISASSICDAIIMDLSDEKPKAKLEQKTRQVEKILLTRSKAGCHVCLIIEEAHDLSVRVLKLLKRFYEIEDGYKKAMGIILIGQPELGQLFNEADHYDMREVIRRCQIAEIRGLNGNLKDYLTLKFKRVGITDISHIITDDAIAALSEKLTIKDERGRKISNAYPLSVNNSIIRAMNLAYELGAERVTAEVMQEVRG